MSAPDFDRLAGVYERGSNPGFYRGLSLELAAELRRLSPRFLGGRALDLACGTGISTAVLREALPDLSWIGADASWAMLARARAKPELRDVELLQARAEQLPFDDGSLELVTCSFGLHWLEPRAWDEIRRVLRPGGVFAAALPTLAPGEQSGGQRLLRRALRRWRGKNPGLESPAPGLRRAELARVTDRWPGASVRALRIEERFASAGALFSALESRGSLLAIFGPGASPPILLAELEPMDEPVTLLWSVSLLIAKKPLILDT